MGHDAGAPAQGVRGARVQAGDAVGDDRHDPQRLPRGVSVALSPDAVPRLWRLARLDYDPARQRPVLLYPEGAVLLNDTGRAILELVDGTPHAWREIAARAGRALPDRRHRRRDRVPVAPGGEGADPMTTERPTTLLAELTHRCPLHCPYCSNPLDLLRAESEIGDRGLEAGLHPGARAGRAAARPVGRRAAGPEGPRGAGRARPRPRASTPRS